MRKPHRAGLRLQQLEGRDVPANLTVSFAGLTGTLTVTGTDDANQLTITADAADPTHFVLTSPVDTFNGAPGPFATPSGVKNLVVRMKAGNDSVTLAPAPAITLAGSLTVNGGDGANMVSATNLAVARNVSIKNGNNAAGEDVTNLLNTNVGGGLTIANGDGNTTTVIHRNIEGVSAVGGGVRVINGTGTDITSMSDLYVGANVTVRNGHAAANDAAGTTQLYSFHNRSTRTLVKGSVTVSYLDGTATSDAIVDREIGGDLTFSYGSGGGALLLDNLLTSLPTLVHGNVTITGTGAKSVTVGSLAIRAGLVVGENFSVTGGAGVDTLTLNRLTVNGATALQLGDGADAVTIDDSLFFGPFNLTTGAGADVIRIDTTAGTSTGTVFVRAVRMSLGTGADSLTLGGNTDIHQNVVFGSIAIVHHGAEADTLIRFGKDVYPFGGDLQWLV